jgi:hypothetical protein
VHNAMQVKGRISMVGGRASLWTSYGKWKMGTFRSCSSPEQEQCSARKRLGRKRPKNAGLLAAGSESLPSPSTSHNHGGQRTSIKESNCISCLLEQFNSHGRWWFCPQIAPRDGLPPRWSPAVHVPNGDDALLASLWSRDCILAPEAGTRPSSISGQ